MAIGIPAGVTVELFGLQAEAQPQPSVYKKTAQPERGVSSDEVSVDSLRSIAAGLNDYSVEVKLTSKAGD